MELWTEYEGKTIDGAFPLNKLLAPEGRSAFFSTANDNGDPTLIRLIESHFDADEILARWHGVQALGHPNLLRLDRYNQVAMDGTTVIYAVMEPVEANLAAVVSTQRLTVHETMQLAASLTSALDVLHTHGFVHEHVEPANIFAVGDVVKLRSDCIREAPEGEEGAEAKRRDIHDLAVVVLQALTQERTLAAAARELPLPSPFDHIVRKSMSGEWGVGEIQAALQTRKRPSAPSTANGSIPTGPAPAIDQPTIHSPEPISRPTTSVSKSAATNQASSRPSFHVQSEARWHDAEEDESSKTPWRVGSIVAAALVGILLFWLGWHFTHRGSGDHTGTNQPNATSSQTKKLVAHRITPSTPAPATPATGTNLKPASNNASAPTQAQWRVIAFTYNHKEQAQKKSADVAAKYPQFHPQVFTPNGHAPYLVTVGGVMSRDDALAFTQKARTLGLPRDTYAQNYSGYDR